MWKTLRASYLPISLWLSIWMQFYLDAILSDAMASQPGEPKLYG